MRFITRLLKTKPLSRSDFDKFIKFRLSASHVFRTNIFIIYTYGYKQAQSTVSDAVITSSTRLNHLSALTSKYRRYMGAPVYHGGFAFGILFIKDFSRHFESGIRDEKNK